jgi:6-phosphogluconolactonase
MAPRSPSIRVVEDPAELARAGADEILRRSRGALAARGVFHIVLSGGSTPRGVYAELAARTDPADLAWWTFWFGDERCVPPTHADSNFRMASEALFAPAGIAPERIHRLRGEDPVPEAAAADYDHEIRRAFGGAPGFDLVLLGLGRDGHVASLFPGSTALRERERLVVAHQVSALGTWRLTLTFPALNAARAVHVLVAGTDKAEALAAVLGDGARSAALPAARVRPRHGSLLWLVDRAAFARTPTPPRG